MEDIQETQFYHEDPLPAPVSSPLLFGKDNLHLNLQTDVHNSRRLEQLRRNNIPTEINSPDFNFLKLASPDLEKMLLAFQSAGNDSPNGTSHGLPIVPTTANSSEHIVNTKGFAEALQDLHDRQDIHGTQTIVPQLTQDDYVENMTTDQLYLTTDASGAITVATSRDQESSLGSFSSIATVPNVKEKQLGTYVIQQFPSSGFPPNNPSTQLFTAPLNHPVEEMDAARALAAYNNVLAQNIAFPSQVYKLDGAQMFGDGTGLEPIDLEVQELVKRERKKQRNRVASSKCRKRKLEKEAVLEVTVKELKARNVELGALANTLKEQICELKQRVMDHVSEGCPITLQHVEDPSRLFSGHEWELNSERTPQR